MSKEFLYSRSGFAAIVLTALWWGAVPRLSGQMPQLKRPEQQPEKVPEAKKPKKKMKGPRAVGLLQLNSAGKGTLVPIAILVDGKFYDASLYKADPIPMALERGTVYEVEQTGESEGLFTVNGALHAKEGNSVHPWMGSGAFLPRGTEAEKSTRKAENVPVGIDIGDSDGPPRLTRGDSGKSETPDSKLPAGKPTTGEKGGDGSSSGGSTKAPANSEPGQTAGSSPVTEKPTEQNSTVSSGAKSQDSKEASASGQGGNGQTSSDQKAPGQASSEKSSGETTPGGEKENYYRPRLRRGKPTESAPAVDELATKPAKPASGAEIASVATAGSLQMLPAISDEGGPDPRTYKFFWKTGEEDDRRGQMLDLAVDEIRAYVNALTKNTIPAKAVTVKVPVSKQKPAAKAVQPTFENTQFRAFDVWGNNQGVMILTTEGHFPPMPGAAKAPESYSVTIVARTDIYGNLRKIYSGVTDKFHLDVTPRLELIDAVDADGDGRGELMFRETTDAGNGYVIYRATADKLWKMFDSLGEK